jgi:hypothetical protein
MHVTPLGHIILIPSQPVFALSPNAACLAGKRQISMLVFGLTQSGLKPQSTALEASTPNHYTIDAVKNITTFIPE